MTVDSAVVVFRALIERSCDPSTGVVATAELLGYGTVTVEVTVVVTVESTTWVVVMVVTSRLATPPTGSPPGYTLTKRVSVTVS